MSDKVYKIVSPFTGWIKELNQSGPIISPIRVTEETLKKLTNSQHIKVYDRMAGYIDVSKALLLIEMGDTDTLKNPKPKNPIIQRSINATNLKNSPINLPNKDTVSPINESSTEEGHTEIGLSVDTEEKDEAQNQSQGGKKKKKKRDNQELSDDNSESDQ